MGKLGCTYFMQLQNADGYVKIGYSANVAKRQAAVRTHSPYQVKLLALLLNESFTTEHLIHKILQNSKIVGEWFYPSIEVMNCIEHVKNNTFNTFIDDYINNCRNRVKYVEAVKPE